VPSTDYLLLNHELRMAKDTAPKKVNILNRRASHEYAFLAKYDAGIMLQGTEIKSIRDGNVNMQDGFCLFHTDGSLWVHNLTIAKYTEGTYNNHEPMRERKLLLTKRELKPLRMFVNDRGFAKLEIALAKGKKLYDKREDLKAKDQKREMDRARDY
jgi:SsrA-binding protein